MFLDNQSLTDNFKTLNINAKSFVYKEFVPTSTGQKPTYFPENYGTSYPSYDSNNRQSDRPYQIGSRPNYQGNRPYQKDRPATYKPPYKVVYDEQSPPPARFFVMKSLDEDNIHKGVKFNIWCSTMKGNQKLQKAWNEAAGLYPIFLLFSFFIKQS